MSLMPVVTTSMSSNSRRPIAGRVVQHLVYFPRDEYQIAQCAHRDAGRAIEDVFVVYSPQLVAPNFAAELEHRIVTVCTI